MRTLLDPMSLELALAELPGWRRLPDRPAIARSLRFRNFREAFGFMTRLALVAESLDHHPEWSNVYNRVELVLTTHDAGGVTELDLKLARAVREILASPPPEG